MIERFFMSNFDNWGKYVKAREEVTSRGAEALARLQVKGERITGKSLEEHNTPRTPTAFDLAIKPYAEQFRPQNFPETQYHDVKSTNHLGDFGRGSLQSTMWLPDVGLYTYDKAWQGCNNIGQWMKQVQY